MAIIICTADQNIKSFFRASEVCLTNGNGFIIGCVGRNYKSGLYTHPDPMIHISPCHALYTGRHDLANLGHRRLAHINPGNLQIVHKHAEGVPKPVQFEEVCRPCRLGKAYIFPFFTKFERVTDVGDVIQFRYAGAFVAVLSSSLRIGIRFYRRSL